MRSNKTKAFPLATSDSSKSCFSLSHTLTLVLFLLHILQHLTAAIALGNETDHIALLAIKSKLVDHPQGVLSSWNRSIHHCNWEGVTCGRKHMRVTSLDLNSRSLSGTISPFIGNMSFLEELWLFNNSLLGQIPPEVGRLFRLRDIQLSNNTFVGQIPANLSGCINLQVLDVNYNKLDGNLPRELGSLSQLKHLHVAANSFTGSLFEVIGNLTSLQVISASFNAFTGAIHESIARMRNLTIVEVGENELSGILPPYIFNLSSLQTLEFDGNQLEGSLPPDIAITLPRLKILNLFQNHLSGPIPTSIPNLTSLEYISLGLNNFTGLMQLDFGRLPSLYELEFSANNLVGGLNFIDTLVNCSNLAALGFAYNYFTGSLPQSIANLSTNLYGLVLHQNQLSGAIPVGITNLVNLEVLTVAHNDFIGTIPHDIGKFQDLGVMDFSFNGLTGDIPNSFRNLARLNKLDLSRNKLEGSIPPTLGSCQSLSYLDLSHNDLDGTLPNELFGGLAKFLELHLSQNHIEGPLPLEISKQTNLVKLNVSKNKFSGEIPNSLSNCLSLQYLNMEGNSFHGNIPSSFTSLKSLQTIDLSHNNLSGPLPDYLSVLPLLTLSLSYNNFEGRVPTDGIFANASAISLSGNPKLCGGTPELHLQGCMEKERKKKRIPRVLKLTIPIICILVGVAMAAGLYLIYHKNKRETISTDSVMGEAFLRVSYNMLLKATDGFSSENLLGAGTFGTVFKGILEPYGKTVAVKVLNLERQGASKSFMAECKALKNIRHRNLVKIVTACSSIDFQGNDFKALVYEFMPSGSLERWLHQVENLSLVETADIAIDVACALDYLHHGGETPVVHCDLKPSNILLDNDLVAHVGDFGLAKFLFQHQNPNQSSTAGIRGTVGYAAPEYGLGGEASTEGDTYSFGILLLELMTGKRPTDSIFKEGFTLHMYAKAALPNPDNVLHIVNPILTEDNESDKEINESRTTYATLEQRAECMVSVVKIGVACSASSPQDRMKVTDALNELRRARDIISNARPSVSRKKDHESPG